MKKINFKQPKYIFPLVIFIPLIALAYFVTETFSGGNTAREGVVSDSINMSLPDARNEGLGDKMSEMSKRFSEDGAYTAISGIGEEKEVLDSTRSGYNESELNAIDADNAARQARQKAVEDMERSLAESRKHINSYAGSDYGSSAGSGSSGRGYNRGSNRQEEMDDYARELEDLQARSRQRQKAINTALGIEDPEEKEAREKAEQEKRQQLIEQKRKEEAEKNKAELVHKISDPNADKFNTVGQQDRIDEPLIKAMIDKTTKAHEGTRLRFKLLDDVSIKDLKLKKGTYLYGTVTGFGQQRVKATITSILIGNKFIKVNLSVFDNDGMEGFYVPESAFRDMMKDAGAQAMQQNISFDGGYNSGISGEAIALQALQNMYQSASSAVSANIRKNKARIKYNTIVYLVNTDIQ